MGARGPKPSGKPGKTVGAHCDADTLAHLEEVTYTRKKTQSFIAAEAIRLGLPLVEAELPQLRKPKKRRRAAAAKKAGTGPGRKKAAARAPAE